MSPARMLMAIDRLPALQWSKRVDEGPSLPKSKYFCSYHREYRHDTNHCRQLRQEIERLIQAGYLKNYVDKEKKREQREERSRQYNVRYEGDSQRKEYKKKGNPEEGASPDNAPAKGVIHMIAGAPRDGNSERASRAHAGCQDHYGNRQQDVSKGPNNPVYQQMELGDIPLEPVDKSLCSFAGEVVHPLGHISLPLSLGSEPARRTKMIHFLVVDMPSAYNLILGRPTLNIFQAVISTNHMKMKFPLGDKIGEVQGDQYTAWKCYVEVIKSSTRKMEVDAPNRRSHKDFPQQEGQQGIVPAPVQPTED
ncbi:UNVERIFIED_CONTAM: hypothetical protein Slati_2492200 [Sesamum latifolium]|uniref:Gag-pol polyprotein n=1 Tax=Sesamum latifolium TaxID=2727402 RepID=A0AAW2WEM4_9LAMI